MSPPLVPQNDATAAPLAPVQRDTTPSRLSLDFFVILACIFDGLSILAATVIAYRTSSVWDAEQVQSEGLFALSICLVCVIALIIYRAYRLNILRSPLRHFSKIAFPFLGAFAFALLAIEAVVDPVFLTAEWPWKAVLLSLLFLASGRMLLLFMLLTASRRGWVARRVAILGAGEQGSRLVKHLERDHLLLNRIVGVFDDRTPTTNRVAADLGIAGGVDALLESVKSGKVDDVIIALPWFAESRLRGILADLEAYAVNIRLSSDLAAFQFPGKMSTDVLTGLPMITISANPLSGWRRVIKVLEDRFLGTFLLLLFSPLMLIIAAAIKLDSPGPVFFRQQRLGFNNRSFSVYKFRSMTHGHGQDKDKTKQATREDQRITRVGRLIRRTSLDELPQLFNVIDGSMSLVGPRPHAIDHNIVFGQRIDKYFSRHKVKPGITGLAQINGLRGETDTLEKMEYRVRYDLYYIENWSVLMDLEILALSAFIGFFGRNAY
ncbi:MAG: undecaprenyl-phosphate glucose phosphotransferase [Pseudomonadota bacterium]